MSGLRINFGCPLCNEWYEDYANSRNSVCWHCNFVIVRNEDGTLTEETKGFLKKHKEREIQKWKEEEEEESKNA